MSGLIRGVRNFLWNEKRKERILEEVNVKYKVVFVI